MIGDTSNSDNKMDSQPSTASVDPKSGVHPDKGEPSAISHSGIFSKARGLFPMAFADRSMEEKFLSQHRDDTAEYLKWGSLIGAAIMFGFMWQDNFISANGYKATEIRIYGAFPVSALAWYLSRNTSMRRFISYISSLFWLIYTCLTISILLVYEPGPYGLSSSIGGGSFLILLFGIYAFSNLRFWASVLVGLLSVLIYTVSAVLWTDVDLDYFFFGDFLNTACFMFGGSVKNLLQERAQRRQFLTSERLTSERKRYRDLLFTLVPSQIAARIEAGEFPIVDSQAEVTILFADIVDFTTLTRKTSPRTLIKVLNDLFFDFDKAAEQRSVEKIKTIGDGYMAVCGPPIAEDKRTIAIVEFAKEMLIIARRVTDESGLPLKLRIGIHSGSLIAGVIGKSRYTYDMWGESVNLASRMEATGIADQIQISEATYLRIGSHYTCHERDTVEVKGVGVIKRYILDVATK